MYAGNVWKIQQQPLGSFAIAGDTSLPLMLLPSTGCQLHMHGTIAGSSQAAAIQGFAQLEALHPSQPLASVLQLLHQSRRLAVNLCLQSSCEPSRIQCGLRCSFNVKCAYWRRGSNMASRTTCLTAAAYIGGKLNSFSTPAEMMLDLRSCCIAAAAPAAAHCQRL